MISQALMYLSEDFISRADMIEPIRRNTAEVISVGKNYALILETISGAYMIAADTAEDGVRLLSMVKDPKLMSIHRNDTANEAARRFGLSVTMECHTAVWLNKSPPAMPVNVFDICMLGASHAENISAMYSHPGIAPGYINGRITAGEMFGAFRGDELAGFIGLHEEGSMGMLEVASGFRRQGAATSLVSYLCAWLIQRGRTPFSQFTTDNLPSRRLHEHIGFVISNELVYWLEQR